jgi:hypothetical protein
MDLTNKPIIKTSYDLDPDTNILTITLKDYADVLIDTIIIENVKYKAFMKALEIVASERITTLTTQVGHRTVYKSQTNEAETVFV